MNTLAGDSRSLVSLVLRFPQHATEGERGCPQGQWPRPPARKIGSVQPTPMDVYRKIEELWDKKMDEITRLLEQHLVSLEQDARQPRLAMVADGQADTKTHECTKGAAKAVQARHGDRYTAQRVQNGPKISTYFGVMDEPPALPCRDDIVVENGAAAPKSCLPSLEMHSPTVVGGLLLTGETSTATEITFNQPTRRLYVTEETNLKTSTQPVSYDSSFLKNNLLAAPSCRRIIETKSVENSMFDLGGSQGRLRACPFSGSWHALLCGELHVRAG